MDTRSSFGGQEFFPIGMRGRGRGRGGGGGGGRGPGHDPGPGRHRGQRWITALPEANLYRPQGIPPEMMTTVTLTLEELEAIRLVDYDGLDQSSAAMQMGVSRKTLWNDLKSGRKKVASALINGYAIRIEGGNYLLRGELR